MTFDDENKPKSQDFPNTQVPQALGNEVEPQNGAVAANAGSSEEANAEEAARQLGHNARQADSDATQMFNPNDYAQWNSFKDSTQQMPSAAQLQEQQTDSSQTYISTVPPVKETQPKKRKKLSKIVVLAVIAAAVFMLFASVGTASDITVPLIAVLAFIPALLSVLSVIFTRKDGKVGGRIGAYVAIGVTVAAVVVMGGRMIAYTAHAKAEHKAAIEASCQSITWPDGDFAKKLPSLANQKGEVYSDSSDYVSIKLCNATQSSFDSYVKDAKKMGFIVDYDKSAHSFTAKDADDNEITVFFMEDEEDGNTMDITLDAPKSEDDSKSPGFDRQSADSGIAEPAAVAECAATGTTVAAEPAKPAIRPIAGQCRLQSLDGQLRAVLRSVRRIHEEVQGLGGLHQHARGLHEDDAAIHRHHEQVECD